LIFEKQAFEGVYLIQPNVHKDNRGYFFESFRHSVLFKNTNKEFVQDNEAFSEHANVIRGLHYQIDYEQCKLIHVATGRIKDVIVDIRKDSPSFGKSLSFNLDSENHHMLFVPEGFAHGYLVLEEKTLVMYKCTNYYNPKKEYGIKWDDPDINIDWGIVSPVMSDKDSNLPLLKNQSNLPL
jgi:dTDP-4-dehydrorhamnose 3,5-epimerase